MVKLKLLAGALLAAAALVAAPQLAWAADSAAAPTEIAPKTPLPDVPRNQELILGWSITSPIGVTNPWAVPGYTHQEGNTFMWEPLMYYGIFNDKFIPWLATSMEYTSKDFTSLEIKLNPAAKWSDGTPVTADDVVFTFEGQMKNEKLSYHTDFSIYVDSVTAKDPQTVEVKFKIPAPRFKFEVLTEKFDTGIDIVPKSWESAQKDVNAAFGGTDIPHSGPYDLVAWNANQKILDLRPDWWGIKGGLLPAAPAVKRIIMVNIGGQVGQNMDTVAQRVVNNEMDASLDMRAQVIGNILAQNPKVQSWTGDKPPFGYRDWWPNSLWMNDTIAPYSDVRVRRAMSLTIDRPKIDKVLYDGAHVSTIYPFPLYPALQKFVDSPEVKALEAKYQPGKFDLKESGKLMEEAGFKKNGDGLWEKDGKTVNATINGFEGIHSDIAPVLVEMLRRGGFDAAINFGTDAQQNMNDGVPGLYLFGHGASLIDPFAAFELYDGKYSTPNGAAAGNGRWSRYNNPEYNDIMNKMAPLGSDDPQFFKLAVQAMGIYWRDVIDIPVIQWLHRIPYNNTYWTNWPSSTNVANGENGAFWAHTGLIEVLNLKPSGK